MKEIASKVVEILRKKYGSDTGIIFGMSSRDFEMIVRVILEEAEKIKKEVQDE